ncbi:OLC1v1036596C2 [Oldenlandia corymbosa var. corymbosa]|nr:OLC1v1036596C2 [Oldenlandia corymbosa var. corymbosa]
MVPSTVMSDDAAIHRNQSSSEVSDASPMSLKATAYSEGRKLHDSESSYDSSDNGKSSSYGQSKSVQSGHRTLSTLTRSSSKRAVRILFKKNSFNPRKAPLKNSQMSEELLNVERATCSSIIKDARFPEHVELEPGQEESQRTSFVKVCPYHHCSLNGHCHDPPPQKKPFLRRRKQSSELGKTVKSSSGSAPETKRSAGKKKGSKKNQVPSNAECLVHEASYLESEDTKGSNVVLHGASDHGNNGLEFCVREGISLKQEELSPEASVEIKESSSEFQSQERELEISKAPEKSLGLRKSSLSKGKSVSMWHLIHKHMVSDLAAEEETKPHQETDMSRHLEDAQMETARESSNVSPDFTDPNVGTSDQDKENQDIEIRKLFAIKLVREAIEKILLPEVQDQLSESQSVTSESAESQELTEKNHQEDPHEGTNKESATMQVSIDGSITTQEIKKQESQSGKKPDKKSPSNWSNLKKWVLLQRFVKELEKVRKINDTKPRQLQLETDPSSEKLSLRRPTGDEKKKAEEWMLDYALQQVVSQLAPTQRRKVALLVKAFETVVPPQEDGVQMTAKAAVLIRQEDRKLDADNHSSVLEEKSNTEKQNTPVMQEVQSPTKLCSETDYLRNASSTDATLEKSQETISATELSSFATADLEADSELSSRNEKIKVASEQSNPFSTRSRDVEGHPEEAEKIPAKDENIKEMSELAGYKNLTPSSKEIELGDGNDRMDEAFSTSQCLVADQTQKTEATENLVSSSLEQEGSTLKETKSETVLEPGRVQAFPPLVNEAAQLPLDKQNYLRLWHSVCQHVVSSVATKLVLDEDDEETEEANKPSAVTTPKGINEERHHKAEFTRSQVLKLVKEAVQEILSPEIQDDSSDTLSVSSEILPDPELPGKDHNEGAKESASNMDGLTKQNTEELDKSKEDPAADEEKELTKDVVTGESSTKVETVDKSINDPPKPRNWRKLKQMILLKRSIKAMEKARKLKFGPQNLLPLPSDGEPEKVDLKHQMMDERRKAEQWMLDYAVQNIVTKLTPTRKKRVAMLVEAFEAVVPLPET